MSLTSIFGLLGALVVLAFVANRQFPRTRVPDVVVLLVVGLLIGPVFGLVEAEQYHDVTRAFGTLAIMLILFEGGLELNVRETFRHFPGGFLLATLGFFMSMSVVAIVMRWSLHVPWVSAALIGAVVGCTSSSILLPVLQQLHVRNDVKVPLLVESSLGDVIGVLTVRLLLDYAAQGGPMVRSFVGGFLWEIAVSLILATLVGLAWPRILPLLSEPRFWNVLSFAAVLLLYALTESLGASGLVAVLGFGLALSNLTHLEKEYVELAPGPGADAPPLHTQVHSFHSQLAFLVRTFFFVLLGAVVQLGGLRGYLFPAMGGIAALFVARWLAIQCTRPAWRGLDAREREVLLWMMPRGLITAVLAIQVYESRGAEFLFLPAVAFTIIVVTNLGLIFGIFRASRAPSSQPPSEAQPEAVSS